MITVKVSDVMHHVHNHFVRDVISGDWAHESGRLMPTEALVPGLWVALVDSSSDAPCGVFQLNENCGIPGLGDMQWTGRLYRLNPPPDFIRLCGDISCWTAALSLLSAAEETPDWAAAFSPALARYKRSAAEVQL